MRPRSRVRRRFRVAPEKVFAAFSEARWVARWLSPSPDIKLSLLQFEFREGGAYRFAYHVPGGQVMTVRGAYRLIDRPSKLVFSWLVEAARRACGPRFRSHRDQSHRTASSRNSSSAMRNSPARTAGSRHAEGWRGALESAGCAVGTVGRLPC